MAMSPFVTGALSSCPNAANLPGSMPAAIAVAPAPRAPFFRNDRRLPFSFVKLSDCFIFSLSFVFSEHKK
jgi:hypothetical protein